MNKYITKALFNMGYIEPSKVQEEVVPKLLNKENIVVKSRTGSGKTASFGIPICENINIENNNIQALIVVPTRELALQVKDEISNIGRLKKIRCSAIFGKQPIKEQIFELKQRVHIVVATPGRIIDHINRETINLNNLEYFIIDEADKMLNKGFVDDMEFIFNNIPTSVTAGLFSATIDKEISHICEMHIGKYNEIIVNENCIYKNKIEEKLMYSKEEDRYENLKNIIYDLNPETTIIFLNTKDKVSQLYRRMKKDKFLVEQLHGDMSQEKRIFTIKDLKNGKYNVLVSTDVASRGIHIDDISLVINYDVPRDKENYIHRIGRTGRHDRHGKAVTIVSEKDKKYIDEIKEYIGYDIDVLEDIKIDEIKSSKYKFEQKSVEIFKNRKKINNKEKTHSEVTRIYLNAGKKKKIRIIDIVGTFSNIKGINNEDIGVIEVHDLYSYVDLLNYKGEKFLKEYNQINIKKKLVKVRRDNKM
ncbi:DEAD/DEAH box helicase [Paraclostridium bifermentans]|nr:DEAD/DEAH box helicase [Paraclostridium bifermentans]